MFLKTYNSSGASTESEEFTVKSASSDEDPRIRTKQSHMNAQLVSKLRGIFWSAANALLPLPHGVLSAGCDITCCCMQPSWAPLSLYLESSNTTGRRAAEQAGYMVAMHLWLNTPGRRFTCPALQSPCAGQGPAPCMHSLRHTLACRQQPPSAKARATKAPECKDQHQGKVHAKGMTRAVGRVDLFA